MLRCLSFSIKIFNWKHISGFYFFPGWDQLEIFRVCKTFCAEFFWLKFFHFWGLNAISFDFTLICLLFLQIVQSSYLCYFLDTVAFLIQLCFKIFLSCIDIFLLWLNLNHVISFFFVNVLSVFPFLFITSMVLNQLFHSIFW